MRAVGKPVFIRCAQVALSISFGKFELNGHGVGCYTSLGATSRAGDDNEAARCTPSFISGHVVNAFIKSEALKENKFLRVSIHYDYSNRFPLFNG